MKQKLFGNLLEQPHQHTGIPLHFRCCIGQSRIHRLDRIPALRSLCLMGNLFRRRRNSNTRQPAENISKMQGWKLQRIQQLGSKVVL